MLSSITGMCAGAPTYCVMDELFNYLRQFAVLTRSDIESIALHAQEISLARGDYFLDVNEVPKCTCFISQGVLRTGCYNVNEEEMTMRFVRNHHFLTDFYALNITLPSREFVQAATDSKLITFTREDICHLSARVAGWETIMAIVAIRVLKDRNQGENMSSRANATLRYKAFVQNHPDLLEHVGLNDIASYLRISKSTLSRIRRKSSERTELSFI
jgi:hypothetical protein